MAKYIEMIDKYRIEQGEGDYNPPSYRWVDNTGKLVRCGECKWLFNDSNTFFKPCEVIIPEKDWYCAYGEREVQE